MPFVRQCRLFHGYITYLIEEDIYQIPLLTTIRPSFGKGLF